VGSVIESAGSTSLIRTDGWQRKDEPRRRRRTGAYERWLHMRRGSLLRS
jgi:hypothetical protein